MCFAPYQFHSIILFFNQSTQFGLEFFDKLCKCYAAIIVLITFVEDALHFSLCTEKAVDRQELSQVINHHESIHVVV